ncbi:MAG: DUF4185 domain-containing protein [Fimbriimonas sp.]
MNLCPSRLRTHFRRIILILAALGALAASVPAQLTYHAGTTRKLFQLTGDYDTALRRYTVTRTGLNAGLTHTDLGASFMHNGKLWFAFGDSRGRSTNDLDFLASTTATRISDFNNLTIRKNPDNLWEYIDVPGISELGFEVPSGAISSGGNIYLVQTTAGMNKSVMARSSNDGDTWTNLYTLSDGVTNMSTAHFINVGMRMVNAADFPGLLPWSSGDVVLIWGAGQYRASNLYLAAIPASSIGTKSAMRYVSGINGSNVPTWSSSEAAAVPLFTQPVFGEYSCTWIPQQNCWLLLYCSGAYAGAPRGLMMRSAPKPWGPWSAPTTIFNPDTNADGGYGRFMHINWAVGGHYDKIQDFVMGNGNDEWGGEYGGYLIEPFTSGDSTNTQIYYTLSTWNPYQTIVMTSEIGPAATTAPPTSGTQTLTLGDATWNKSSTTFYNPATIGGQPGISTWTSSGDATTGLMWRFLPRDQWNESLSFSVTSGNGEVILLDGAASIPTTGSIQTIYNDIKNGVYGDVLQATWGHEDNGIVVPVTWNLKPFDRANLKVVVIDYSTLGWSFLGCTNMTLTRNQPTVGTNTQTVMPGDGTWTKTAGSWFANFTSGGGVPHITTYGSSGDASQGVMWRMLPRDWKNKQLTFTYHGGHSQILLLQGGTAIPTTGTFATIRNDLLNGKYGKVLKSITGPNSNSPDIAVTWNLEQLKSDDLKVVVVDGDTDPWGFISVSQMTLTRYN